MRQGKGRKLIKGSSSTGYQHGQLELTHHWGILRSSLIFPPPEEGGAGVFKHQLPSRLLLGAEGGPYLPGTSSLHGCSGRAEKARRREAGANTESQVQCARKWHRPRGCRKGSSYSCCYKNKSQKGDKCQHLEVDHRASDEGSTFRYWYLLVSTTTRMVTGLLSISAAAAVRLSAQDA